MRIINSEEQFTGTGCVVALGTFDGLHMAHRRLISEAVAEARARDLPCLVYTFDRHPISALRPGEEPEQLMSREEKLKKLASLGVDIVLMKPFTGEFAETEPEEFIETLVSVLKAKLLAAGFNFRFGAKGRGDAALMKTLAPSLGCGVLIMDEIRDGDDTVSSTLIRQLRTEGREERARHLLED